MRKYCYFFCYEGAAEGKNVRKKTEKGFGLETFFVKGSNLENIGTNAGNEN